MNCPDCGKYAGVIDSRRIQDGGIRVRRRKCHPEWGGCGRRFNTVERYEDVGAGPLFKDVKSRKQITPPASIKHDPVDQEANTGRDARATGPANKEVGCSMSEVGCTSHIPHPTSDILPAVSIGNYLGDPQAAVWPEPWV